MAVPYTMNPWDWGELVAGCVLDCLIAQKLVLIFTMSQAFVTAARTNHRPLTSS